MAAAAAAAAAGGGDANDFSRVYRAVASGVSEAELRRVIEEVAQGDDERRAQAVNHSSSAGDSPLQAAASQKRGDLVGALVEAGAGRPGVRFGDCKLTPLAVCIAYGQVESVRALLRAGHDANEKVETISTLFGLGVRNVISCAPVHLALAPPALGLPSDRSFYDQTVGAPQIGCLEVLLREGGADVNAADDHGETPIHWLARFGSTYDDEEERAARGLLVSAGARILGVLDSLGFSPLMMAAASNNICLARFLVEEAGAPVDERSRIGGSTALLMGGEAGAEMVTLLLDAGADIEARDDSGWTMLHSSVLGMKAATTRVLLDRGASVNVVKEDGNTPLISACGGFRWLRDDEGRWPLFQAILRRSSAKTRRSQPRQGVSAADRLALYVTDSSSWYLKEDERMQQNERCCWAISELLASGASLRPESVGWVLPVAASLSAGRHARLAARLAELCSWRAHETFVGVSLDVKEMRAVEREVADKRARVAALERELEELGAGSGTETSSGSSSGGGSEEGEGDEESEESDDEGDVDGGEEELVKEGRARAAALEGRMSGFGLGDRGATEEREAAAAARGGGGAE